MVWYITGSNIFGQWSWDELVINQFHVITETKPAVSTSLNHSKLLQINWSYNILQIDNELYVSGAWNGQDNQFVAVPIPAECIINTNENFIAAGNDHSLVLVNKHTIWVLDLKHEKEIKKINLNVEEPIVNVYKKKKIEYFISKVVLKDNSCLFLTSEGNVYSGILPSYVDTTHCDGQVCDIQCGYEHYVLLTNTGVIYTWGNGRRLQLGHGDVSNTDIPTEVEALSGIKITKISSGGWHTLALSEFGDLYAWGWNDAGQLGIKHDKEKESYSIPTLVDFFYKGEEIKINVKDIACGSRHSTVVLEDNTVWTSGCNKYGQLGFSHEKFPSISYFKKSFQCQNNSTIRCGPWSTVIISE